MANVQLAILRIAVQHLFALGIQNMDIQHLQAAHIQSDELRCGVGVYANRMRLGVVTNGCGSDVFLEFHRVGFSVGINGRQEVVGEEVQITVVVNVTKCHRTDACISLSPNL